MVFMGLEFAGDIPFDDVYVHSVVQAPDGRRMSKSLGTGIDPLALIDGGPRPPVFTEGGDFPAYGADAVRYGLLAMSSTQDVRFNEGTIAEGRQLANKLFNASRLVLLRVPEGVTVPDAVPTPETVEDTWILSRLQAAEAEVADAIAEFEFHRATRALYRFVYAELCDWYLEMLKPRLYEDDNAAAAEFALHVLAETLALAHPGDPVRHRGDLVAAARRPRPADVAPLAGGRSGAARRGDRARGRPRDRGHAGAAQVARRRRRAARRPRPGAAGGRRLRARRRARRAACRASSSPHNGDQPVATVGVPGGNVAVLASDTVDLEAEKRRAAERAKVLQAEIKRAEGKLANQGFVAKAPEAVVKAEREKLDKLKRELDELS